MGDFGSKYVKYIPTKNLGNDFVLGKKYNSQQENKFILNRTVDEILRKENQKVSDVREASEVVESHFDESKHYQVENKSLEDTIEELECISYYIWMHEY